MSTTTNSPETGMRESQLRLNPDLMQKELKAAQDWLQGVGATADSALSASPRMTRVRFEGCR